MADDFTTWAGTAFWAFGAHHSNPSRAVAVAWLPNF
jgi:hypothetical protein